MVIPSDFIIICPAKKSQGLPVPNIFDIYVSSVGSFQNILRLVRSCQLKYFFIADSIVWEGIINGLSSIIISISLSEMLRYFTLIVPSTDFPSKKPHSVVPSNLPPCPVIMDLTLFKIEDI